MNALINTIKDHQIGTWCKRAAWIVLLIGLVEIVLNIHNEIRQFGLAGQPMNMNWTLLLATIGVGLGNLVSILFYFFILYAVGVLVNQVVGMQATDDEIEEDEDAVLHP